MKLAHDTIHSNPGNVLDCTLLVCVECDGETFAMRFPAIERPDDSIGPFVYAHLRGTELHVTLCERNDTAVEFAWNEHTGRWHEVDNMKAEG
jgi:hypothetical protein